MDVGAKGRIGVGASRVGRMKKGGREMISDARAGEDFAFAVEDYDAVFAGDVAF